EVAEKSRLFDWLLEQHEERRNVYFLANQRMEMTGDRGRPTRTKEDILFALAMYVDIDARADQPFLGEISRLTALHSQSSFTYPPPSAVIDSGGGVQLLWKLTSPYDLLDGAQEVPDPSNPREKIKVYPNRESYEARNKVIEAVLDGDHCHSVEHVFRLPGTVNFCTPKKFARHA